MINQKYPKTSLMTLPQNSKHATPIHKIYILCVKHNSSWKSLYSSDHKQGFNKGAPHQCLSSQNSSSTAVSLLECKMDKNISIQAFQSNKPWKIKNEPAATV